jgi:hypothetical protein
MFVVYGSRRLHSQSVVCVHSVNLRSTLMFLTVFLTVCHYSSSVTSPSRDLRLSKV